VKWKQNEDDDEVHFVKLNVTEGEGLPQKKKAKYIHTLRIIVGK